MTAVTAPPLVGCVVWSLGVGMFAMYKLNSDSDNSELCGTSACKAHADDLTKKNCYIPSRFKEKPI